MGDGPSALTEAHESVFTGLCNRCGSCCAPTVAGRVARCEHLVATGLIGTTEATRCRVYAARYDGMPVRVVDLVTGFIVATSLCRKDSVAEDASIAVWGQGRGCTLRTRGPGEVRS